MKKQSEKRVEAAIKVLLQTISQNVHDAGVILEEFEATHNECECIRSRQYSALVHGYLGMQRIIEGMNKRLTRDYNERTNRSH